MKKKKDKFTFRKQPRETGLNTNPATDIKHNKKIVGYIVGPNWHTKDNQWRIRLMVEKKPDADSNCNWKWITLKKTFDKESEAREFLNQKCDLILETYLVHHEEE